jgi:hypothetical protein
MLWFFGIGVLSAQIIAQQDFNSLPAGNINSDGLPTGSQLTNPGSKNIGGPGLDFSATWFDTRGVGLGPATPPSDVIDFTGINSSSGLNAPDVSADGTAVSDGTEHNFQFNDTDGAVVLNFEAVDVSGFTDRKLRLNYWINDIGFESNDAFTISISNGGLGIVLLGFGETELEANGATDESDPASWNALEVDLDAVLASSGLDPTNLILSIAVDVNSPDENIFVDDIVFVSDSPQPCNISSLTANFSPCFDNNTILSDDDTFIADFTTTFSNPPTTGDIELLVGGQTYSTSVTGLGTQFQFLSITLPADGQPVEATIRFTADPACSLTAIMGTAPGPCSILPPGSFAGNINCGGPFGATYAPATETFAVTSSCLTFTSPNADRLAFVGQPICGDQEVIARISDVQPSNGFAGIMMRESTAPNAKMIGIFRFPNGQKNVVFRSNTGGSLAYGGFAPLTQFMDYVRIVRQGNNFLCYASMTGMPGSWTLIYGRNILMNTCILGGLAVSSYTNGASTTAEFDQVYIGNISMPLGGAGPEYEPERAIQERQPAHAMGALTEGAPSNNTLFPNPVQSTLHLSWKGESAYGQNLQLEILDAQERVLRQRAERWQPQMSWPVDDLPAGVYYLRCVLNDRQEVLRFVK